jgi:hypothetical protein
MRFIPALGCFIALQQKQKRSGAPTCTPFPELCIPPAGPVKRAGRVERARPVACRADMSSAPRSEFSLCGREKSEHTVRPPLPFAQHTTEWSVAVTLGCAGIVATSLAAEEGSTSAAPRASRSSVGSRRPSRRGSMRWLRPRIIWRTRCRLGRSRRP